MIAVRFPKDLEARLKNLAIETHRSSSYYMREALERYLEDREDYLLAVARLEENSPMIPFDEIRKELGLED